RKEQAMVSTDRQNSHAPTNERLLSTQRRRISHVTLIKIHVLFREVGSVHERARASEVEADMQIKFLWRHSRTKLFEARARWLAALQAPENFPIAWRAVTNVDLVFNHGRRAVAQRVNNSAPVRIAAVPTRFNQRAVGDSAHRGIGVRDGLRSIQSHGDES